MKYRAGNHHLRLKEQLDRQCLNYLPNSSSKKVESAIRQVLKKHPSNLAELNKTISKSLLPMLHNKTYFKSLATLSSPLRPPHPRLPTHDDPDEPEPRKEVGKPSEQVSREENSRDALEKCGLARGRGRAGRGGRGGSAGRGLRA